MADSNSDNMDEIIGLFRSSTTSFNPTSSTIDRKPATVPSASTAVMKGGEGNSTLEALPAEVINHILTFLPPDALAALSRTSHLLRSHAHNDMLWFDFVRKNVPEAETLDSPSPAKNWRQLYLAHHPYWFLARHKVWFADVPNTGKIILARFNPTRGCIEAYRLIAEHSVHTFETWTANPDVLIHTFNPRIRLWVEDPVVMLEMKDGIPGKRLQKEVAMHTGSTHGICSMISLCQPIPIALHNPRMGLWPPLIVPARKRERNESVKKFRKETHRPQSLELMSDQTFRIRKWLEFSNLMQPLDSVRMGEEVMTFSTLPEEVYTPTKHKPYQGLWVGDYSGHGCEFLLIQHRNTSSRTSMSRRSSTGSLPEGISIANLEQETPEEHDESIRRIIAENYYSHGNSEYNLDDAGPSTEVPERMHEPESSYSGLSSSSRPKLHGELSEQNEPPPDTNYEHSGRLEAIKLTGDINVPRGQYTWIAEDIGPNGLLRIGREQMFDGARIVRSWGRIAGRGFRHDRFVRSQLILMSPDSIAQFWEVSLFLWL